MRFPLGRPRLDTYAHLAQPAPVEAAQGVRALFLGTSSVLLRDDTTAVLVDGFFTRPGILQLALGRIAPDRRVIAACLSRARVEALAAVICAHSHYDHALDAPVIAATYGAPLVGSDSTVNIGRGYGLPDELLRGAGDGATFAFGDFAVTLVAGQHSPRDAAPGTVDAPLAPPARARAWKTGVTYSIFFRHPQVSVLVHGSANYVPGKLAGRAADIVYLGIGGLGKQTARFRQEYWREVVKATGATTVIPVHWDDPTTALLTQPLRPLPYLVDDCAVSMDFLLAQCQRDGVRLIWPTLWRDMACGRVIPNPAAWSRFPSG